MMNSIKFNDIDTYNDWGLLLKPRKMPKPTPKTNYVDIPGGDGTLDLSEVVAGEIKYNDLSLSFEFNVIDNMYEWDKKVSEIANYLHGRNMKIIQSADPDYYYYGRCSVDEFSSSKALGSIVIKCTVGPYKLKHNKTIVTASLEEDNNKTLYINNDRMTVVPKITCTAATIIKFNGNTYSASKGTHEVLDFQFVEGTNIVELQGTGMVTFEFQEGSL